MLLPIPDDWSFSKAAAIPEAWLTAFVNLFMEGHLATGESADPRRRQRCRARCHPDGPRSRAHVYATVRTSSKVAFCESFGATVVNPAGPFPDADVILDCVGGSYLPKNIQALKRFGRLMASVSSAAPGRTEHGHRSAKPPPHHGLALRSRTRPEQIEMTAQFQLRFWKNFLAHSPPPSIVNSPSKARRCPPLHGRQQERGKIILTVPMVLKTSHLRTSLDIHRRALRADLRPRCWKKGGHVTDPKNNISKLMDVAIANGKIAAVAETFPPRRPSTSPMSKASTSPQA